MISIICIGKKHEAMYLPAIQHFEGRIKPYARLEWMLLPHSSLEGNQARDEESSRIIERIKPSTCVILLDELGSQLTSPELAAKVDQAQTNSKDITFVIGGAYGVNDSIKSRADTSIAFGKAVFPHQLMRVILLEQIYRAYTILSGSHYHHT